MFRLQKQHGVTLWKHAALAFALLFQSAVAGSAQTAGNPYVTTANVQLRQGPGTQHPVVTTIPEGIKINVVGREGPWLKVESKHGSKPGYINEEYARPLDSRQTAQPKGVASANVGGEYRVIRETELRERPGVNEKIITRLPVGIKIHVIRADGDWLRVESKHGGRPGYIEKRDVERWSQR
jgi:uncharacterized protein YraI